MGLLCGKEASAKAPVAAVPTAAAPAASSAKAAAPVVDSGQAVDAARARFLARRKQAKKK